MSQNYNYPSSSDVTLTGSTNGAPAPTTTIVVGGVSPAGNTEPLELDSSGDLKVTVTSTTGTANVNLAQVGGTAIALGSAVEAASIPVVIASDQVVPVSATALPLPAGASTSALQTQISGQLPTTLGAHVTSASLAVNIASDQVVPVSATSLPLPTGASTASNQMTIISDLGTIITNTTGLATSANQNTVIADLGTLITNTTALATAANQTTMISDLGTIITNQGTMITDLGTIITNTTGLATSANQSTEITELTAINTNTSHLPTALGQTTMSASLPVVIASDQSVLSVAQGGRTKANAPFYNAYGTTPITTGAYVQLIASSAVAINYLDIFDSSGQAMILALGASGSEVDFAFIAPGGDQVPLNIPAGTRISYKALTANATAGYLLFNTYT